MIGKSRACALVAALVAAIAAVVWLVARGDLEAAGPLPAGPGGAPGATARTAALPDATGGEPARTPARGEPEPVEPAEPSPTELWGRVVAKADGSPVAGAGVRLLHRDADEFWNLDLAWGRRIDELGRTTSDADGRFRFDVARARAHRLEVRAHGFAPRTVVDCTGGSEVVVELGAGATVEGTVRCGGDPLADAPLHINVVGESLELATGRTGIDGAFRFANVPARDVYLQVRAPDHPETWQRVELQDGGVHRVTIEVPASRSVAGTVRDAESGVPIAGAEIADSWTYQRAARSTADGSFELRGIGADDLDELYCRADGYAEAARNVAGRFDQPVDFELVRGGEVRGRVLTAAGTPPAHAYVAAGASFMMTPGYQHTDWISASVGGDGLFVARGLRPDQHYSLYVRARGFGTRVYLLPRVVGSGERIDIGDVVVHPAAGVEGRVIDEQGEPLAGVSVSIAGTNADARAWYGGADEPERVLQFESRSLASDARGRFRFTDLAAGRYTVRVRTRGHAGAPIARQVDAADGRVVEGIELVVPTGGVIAGTIRYADGRELGDEAGELWLVTERGASARVARGGRFRFEGLAEGKHDLVLFRGPAGWALSPRREVPTGTDDLALVLERAAKIAGRVVDAEGRGTPARVWVQWSDINAGSPIHTTDPDGRFELEVAPGFHGSVHAMPPDRDGEHASAADVVAGRTDLVLRLDPR